jgi:ADP-ribose pyrophosphatase YjhB (NUDIX family)
MGIWFITHQEIQMTSKWIEWARALQAIGQTGLHFSSNPFDTERYQQIQAIAADMLASHSNLSSQQILAFNASEFGYATPKVDVRGVIFRDSKILLVREILDKGRWTLPGGWADVNESPGEAVVREIFEESGFETRAVKLIAVYDREKQGHTPVFPYHVYKLFFLCEIIGGAARPNVETSEIAFFQEDEIPELSVSRVTERQLRKFFAHHRHPGGATEFD